MDEYIKRAEVLKHQRKMNSSDWSGEFWDCAVLVEDIEKIPAADVVEVRHGEWIESFSYGVWHYDCPFCGDGYSTKERQEKPENYCSNCGARMDGGSK